MMNGMDATKQLPVELQLLTLWQQHTLLEIGPSEAEKLTGISKGTLSPKLRALAAAGYLMQSGRGKYTLGPMLPSLWGRYVDRLYSQAHAARSMLDSILDTERQMRAIGAQVLDADPTEPEPEDEP